MLIFVLGIIAGGVSFLVIQFWMNPLLKYLDIKHQVTSDVVYYANVISASDLNAEMQARHRDRQDNNRKHASELRAIYYRLPCWYKLYLKCRGEDIVSASQFLIGLSNTSEQSEGDTYLDKLKKHLRINE